MEKQYRVRVWRQVEQTADVIVEAKSAKAAVQEVEDRGISSIDLDWRDDMLLSLGVDFVIPERD